MSQPVLLSIIVPVYNVAPFLETCLQSLVAQDLSGIEIILVNDGSTDDCPAILARYAAAHPDALRLITQANAGLSAARNSGLDQARGKYIAFVDSDDWIDPAYYRRLLQLAIAEDLDMAHGNAMFHFEGRRDDHPIYQDDLPPTVMPGREVLRRRLAARNFLHMVWMHLYRRDFIEAQRMRFVPGLIHEDVLWTTQAFIHAKRVAYDPTPGYFYRIRVRPFTPGESEIRFEKIIASSIANAEGLAGMAAALADDPELQQLIRWQLVDGGLSVFHKLRRITNPEIRRRIKRQLKEKKAYSLLWNNATLFSQRRRIARNWLTNVLKP